MRTTRLARRTVPGLLLVAVFLAALAAGCGGEDDPSALEEETAEAAAWRLKYESLVRDNEQVYQEIDDLKTRNSELVDQKAAIEEELRQALGSKQERASAEELQRLIAERDARIADLDAELRAAGVVLADVRRELDGLKALKAAADGASQRLLDSGQWAFSAGRYAEARQVFTAAADLGAGGPALLFRIGYCCGELDDDEQASAWYATAAVAAVAIKDDPEADERSRRVAVALLPKIYSNHGATMVALGKPQEALELYQQSLQANEKYAPAHFNLGRLYAEHLDDPAKAIQHYRRHVALGGRRGISARAAIVKLQEQAGNGG